ncbi:hypothetical protein D3C73_1521090 [compost metagenome]
MPILNRSNTLNDMVVLRFLVMGIGGFSGTLSPCRSELARDSGVSGESFATDRSLSRASSLLQGMGAGLAAPASF